MTTSQTEQKMVQDKQTVELKYLTGFKRSPVKRNGRKKCKLNLTGFFGRWKSRRIKESKTSVVGSKARLGLSSPPEVEANLVQISTLQEFMQNFCLNKQLTVHPAI